MVAGVFGINPGPNAPKRVTEEPKQKQESVTNLPQNMEDLTVKEAPLNLKNVTNGLVVRLLSISNRDMMILKKISIVLMIYS